MENFNNNLQDRELYELFKARLMASDKDDVINRTMMEMEEKTAFSQLAPVAIPTSKEKELLTRLKSAGGIRPGLQWFIAGVSILTIGTIFFIATDKNIVSDIKVPLTTRTEPINTPPPTENNIQKDDIDLTEKEQPVVVKTSPFHSIEDKPSYQKSSPYDPVPAPSNGATASVPVFSMDTKYYPPAEGELYNRSAKKGQTIVDTTFAGITKIEVQGSFCNISMIAVPGDMVSMKGEMNIESKGLTVNKSNYKFQYERVGNALKVMVKNTGKSHTVIIGSLIIDGALNFQVPEKTEVIIKNMSGDIVMKGLSGPVCSAETIHGNINAEQISTDVSLKSTSGNINAVNIKGHFLASDAYGHISLKEHIGNIKINSNSGNCTLKQTEGDADIAAVYGNVNVDHMTGNLKAIVASGDLNLTSITGETTEAKTSYGNIHAKDIRANTMLTSNSGDVNAENIEGDLKIKTVYGKQFLQTVIGNIEAKSNSGIIHINKAKGMMNIQSTYGNVTINDCTGKISINVNSGDINGKNIICSENMRLNTGYGNIQMQISNRMEDLSFDLKSSSGHMKISKDNATLTKEAGNLVLTKGSILIQAITTSGNQVFN